MSALIGFNTARAQATDRKGRSLYKDFYDFFDADKVRKGLEGVQDIPATDDKETRHKLNVIEEFNKRGV